MSLECYPTSRPSLSVGGGDLTKLEDANFVWMLCPDFEWISFCTSRVCLVEDADTLQTANKCLNIQADLRKWRTDADTLHIGNKCLWTQSDLRKQAMNGVSSDEFGIGHNLEACPTGYSQQPNTQQISKGCEVPQPSKPLCLHKWICCSSFQHANCYCISLISVSFYPLLLD
jgi:hypothetical protein